MVGGFERELLNWACSRRGGEYFSWAMKDISSVICFWNCWPIFFMASFSLSDASSSGCSSLNSLIRLEVKWVFMLEIWFTISSSEILENFRRE